MTKIIKKSPRRSWTTNQLGNPRLKRICVAALILGAGLLPLERVAGQTFTDLHNFDSGLTNGGIPGAVIISSNVLYGITYFGGSANSQRVRCSN